MEKYEKRYSEEERKRIEDEMEKMDKVLKEKGQAQIVYEYWKNMGKESRKMMNKESTITVKVELSDDDIKECFIKAMEETLKELKKEVDKSEEKC